MPGKNDDFDFGPIMDDDETLRDFNFEDDEQFTFDIPDEESSGSIPDDSLDSAPPLAGGGAMDPDSGKKRTSDDFEPDMDALLLTAQSPMIIEGMKYLTLRD
jgi:hypothetical protein